MTPKRSRSLDPNLAALVVPPNRSGTTGGVGLVWLTGHEDMWGGFDGPKTGHAMDRHRNAPRAMDASGQGQPRKASRTG